MYTSAAAGGRIVVIGDSGDGDSIWSSGNGRDWSPSSLPADLGYTNLYDVTADGNGFIAVGTADHNTTGNYGLGLMSTDGQTWILNANLSRVDEDYRLVAFFKTDGVIYSSDGGWLVSYDAGADWNEPSGNTPGDPLEVISTENGFVAFAGGKSKNSPVTIWTSPGGQSWSKVSALPGSADIDFLKAADGPLGWVVLGSEFLHGKDVTLGWSSTDGQTWQQIANPPFAFSDIFADDAGFIVAGKWLPKPSGCALDPAEYAGVSWTSTDGLTWTRMPDDGWQSRWISTLRRYNRTLIGIGIDYSNPNDFGQGAAWTASLPALATNNGPVPSNPPSPGPGGCGD